MSKDVLKRGLRAARRRLGVAINDIVVPLVVLGLVAAVVVPQFTRAGLVSAAESVKQPLRTVNAAVELYRAQHKDAAPDLSNGWTPLVTRSDECGRTDGGEARLFGPYLPQPPVNPVTGGTTISSAPRRGTDWWWDAATGTVVALDKNGMSVDASQ